MSGSQENNPSRSSSSSTSKADWDPLLAHSSAIGILKPGVVFNVFNTNPASSSSSTAASGSSSSMLPQPRLVRTTHTPSGTSVFASDEVLVPRTPFGPQATAFTVLDIRNAVPVDLGEQTDTSQVVLPRCPPGGVIAAISDIPGGFGHAAPMHRTQSIDYAVVISGEIVLGLDGGEEKVVRAGEFIIQAGTNHTWTNRAAGPCRILFVMVGAEKIVLGDGTVLEETSFKSVSA
ncbi:hypothetical protein BR93DRAFT_322452 [Coniochaeta sp. PMI_546]|nr:hypothetical protein BR93DRAFT_322452 [Coniochaeta sp. PMI_546]